MSEDLIWVLLQAFKFVSVVFVLFVSDAEYLGNLDREGCQGEMGLSQPATKFEEGAAPTQPPGLLA